MHGHMNMKNTEELSNFLINVHYSRVAFFFIIIIIIIIIILKDIF